MAAQGTTSFMARIAVLLAKLYQTARRSAARLRVLNRFGGLPTGNAAPSYCPPTVKPAPPGYRDRRLRAEPALRAPRAAGLRDRSAWPEWRRRLAGGRFSGSTRQRPPRWRSPEDSDAPPADAVGFPGLPVPASPGR